MSKIKQGGWIMKGKWRKMNEIKQGGWIIEGK